MNDRKAWTAPRDNDGTPLIDTMAVAVMVGVTTRAGVRKWCARQGIKPVARGAHGAWMWRHADVQDALDRRDESGVSSEQQADDLCPEPLSASRLGDDFEPYATCIVLSNRKDMYLPAALQSLENVRGISNVVIVDDSGDLDWRRELYRVHGGCVEVAEHSAGYTAAMQMVWKVARELGGPVFFLEEDFTIDTPIDLMDLQRILDADQSLAQVALQRQAWYPIEHRFGLIGAQRRRGQRFLDRGTHLVHKSCFTGNPSLIPPRTFHFPWPSGTWTEDAMTKRLIQAGMHFAYLGREFDQHVTHRGDQRAETSRGY